MKNFLTPSKNKLKVFFLIAVAFYLINTISDRIGDFFIPGSLVSEIANKPLPEVVRSNMSTFIKTGFILFLITRLTALSLIYLLASLIFSIILRRK